MNLYVNNKVMSSKFFGNRTEKKESKRKGFKQISIERIPNRGIGEAINDRLLRAAVKK